MSRLCAWLAVPRSTVYYQRRPRPARPFDGRCRLLIEEIIDAFPFFGIRRVWAYLKHVLGEHINRKKVARLMRHHGWTVRQRRCGRRPRVEGKTSVAARPDCGFATITDWCSARSCIAGRFGTMDCGRSLLRRIRRKRTACVSGLSEASRKRWPGSTGLRVLSRPGGRSRSGYIGTTPNGRIRRWRIAARCSIESKL